MSVLSPDPDADLSHAGLLIGPVLEAAFRQAVTEMALLVETSPSAPLPPDLEHQPVIDFTCDRKGRLVGASPVAKLFGWNPEELHSVATLDLVHPADRPDERAYFARELHDGPGQVLPSLSLFARSIGGGLNGDLPSRTGLAPGSGTGLPCMEERARLLDGRRRVDSGARQGAVVCATLPVPPPGSAPAGRDGVAVRAAEVRR